MMPFVLTVFGLTLLFFGGEALVRGSVALARRLGISEIAVGVVLVGFGTSAPELLVSVESALLDHPDLALGNVLGSNIANILLIVGMAALVMPINLNAGVGYRESVVVLVATVIVVALAWVGSLALWQGIVMLIALLAYLAMAWCKGGTDGDEAGEEEPENLPGVTRGICFAIGGLALLVFGADILVRGAVEIARDLGVGETVIGLTIVAVGSSLPELAASVMAALRGRPSVAIGNVLGSNLFNLLGALGIVAVIMPVDTSGTDIRVSMLVMLALTGIFVALVALRRVGRMVGALFVLTYAGFIWLQFATG
jgi:cation:H+ antiporter